jgi:uncharacterized protein YfaS (alpha-2-macroglobulin family)
LDANGHASFPFDLQMNGRAPAAVKANIVTRVFEAGGDASIDRTDVQYYPYVAYAGLRIPEGNSYWGSYITDTTYAIQAVAVDADGKPLAHHALKAQVVKLGSNWWWSGDMDDPSNYMTAEFAHRRAGLNTDGSSKASFNRVTAAMGPLHPPFRSRAARLRRTTLRGLAGTVAAAKREMSRRRAPLQQRQGEIRRATAAN